MKNTIMSCVKAFLSKKRIKIYFISILVLSILIPIYQFVTLDSYSQTGQLYESYFLNAFDITPLLFIIYVLPLFSGILCGEISIEENEFKENIEIRTNKYIYFFANLMVIFTIGFISMMVVLVLSFIYTSIILQNDTNIFFNPSLVVGYNLQDIALKFSFPNLYINDPFLRIVIYMFIISLYSGILNIFSYCVSLFIRNKLISYIIPFFIVTIIMLITEISGYSLHIQNMVDPQTPVIANHEILTFILLFAYIVIPIFIGCIRIRWDSENV